MDSPEKQGKVSIVWNQIKLTDMCRLLKFGNSQKKSIKPLGRACDKDEQLSILGIELKGWNYKIPI